MEEEEENNNGDPVLIPFNDGIEVGEETGGGLELSTDLDLSTEGLPPLEEKEKPKKIEKNPDLPSDDKKVDDILPDWMKEEIAVDEANLTGNKYNEAKDIFAEISSEINNKTIALLAIKNPDFLDVNNGVVTDKQGNVVETKEDFIKATGLANGDALYNTTSEQFKSDDFKHIELGIKQADEAWHYIKSSYKTETGSLITDLWMGESETLDFGQYEEQIKIEVLNQLDGTRVSDQLAREGRGGKVDIFGNEKFYSRKAKLNLFGDKIPGFLAAEEMSIKEKEELIANAKTVVLANQMKIQNSAYSNLTTLKTDFENSDKKLQSNYAVLQDLQERMQKDITTLNKAHGAWSYDAAGNRKYISYGDMRDWSEADKSLLKSVNADYKKIGIESVKLGIERSNVLALQKTYYDSSSDYIKTTEELFNRFLYNEVSGRFSPAFKQTYRDKAFQESLKRSNPYMGAPMDVMSTFINSVAKYKVASAVVGGIASLPGAVTAVVVGTVGEIAYANRTEANYYGEARTLPFMQDMFNGLVKLGDKDITPVSRSAEGQMTIAGYKSKSETWVGQLYDESIGEGSNWNPYSATKTVADLLGYVVALKSGIGNLDVKTIARRRKLVATKQSYPSGSLGRSISHSLSKSFVASKKFTGAIEMIKVNQKITLLDNIADGRARGMGMLEATAYGNALSFMTGISQSIMPDYNWFNSPGGRIVKEGLVKALTGKTVNKIATNNALKIATKQFGVNFFKEQLEEQVDLGLSDVVKTMFIAGHSPDILKANVQSEVLRGTTLLAGGLGSVQARRTYRNAESLTNRVFAREGAKIIQQGQNEVAALKKHMETLGNSAKDNELKKLLTQDINDLDQNIKDGKDRLAAINAAPKLVTDTQIFQLIQKNNLLKERALLNKKDKAFVSEEIEAINKKIADIDIKIQESTPVKFKEQLMTALAVNVQSLAGKMGYEYHAIKEEDYEKGVEEEIRKIDEWNNDKDEEIKQIDGSTPEGKKKITRLENQKRKLPDFNDPGFIYYDDVNGKHRIVVNEKRMKESHNEAAGLHELLHAVMRQTMLKNPNSIKAISFMMRDELLNNPEAYSGNIGYITSKEGEGKFDQYSKVVNDMAFDELFNVFSEAVAQGNIKVESTLGSKLGDFVRRSLMEVGINFEVSGSKGMMRFLRDYNNEVMRGRFSYGMKSIIKDGMKINVSKRVQDNAKKMEALLIAADESKQLGVWSPKRSDMSRSIKTKASRKDVYEQKRIQNDLQLSDSTAKIVEENKRLRGIILEEGLRNGNKIVASEDLQNQLVENNLALAVSLGTFAAKNPNVMGLEPGKRVNAQQFISGYYLELSNLARTYDASVNEFGQYLNTILPLRYGQILEAEKAGAVEGSVGLDEAKEIVDDANLTPDDVVVGPTVDTAERLGIKEETKPFIEAKLKQAKKLSDLREKISENYNEETAEQIAKLESKGAADLDIDSVTVKQAPNLLYEFTSKLFGIDANKLNPKSTKWLANLRKDDKRGSNEVRAAQRAVVKNVQLILSTIFNDGHTKAHKSSGMPNSLLKFGYNKSSKRIGNSFPQYKKPNLSEQDFLEFVGVFKVKGKYEFKVDRNTGTKLIAIASMVDRNMSLQAINESLSESGDLDAKARLALEDGMSKASKSIYYIENIKLQPIIDAGLASISSKIESLDVIDVDNIKMIIAEEFDGTDVDGKKFANSLTKGYNIISRFVKARARKGDRKFNKTFAEITEKFLKEEEVFRKDLAALLPAGVNEDGKSIETKNDLSTVKRMKQARSRVADFILNVIVKEYNASEKTKADKKRAMELIYMLEQQHITAAKAGDGRTWFIAGTSDTENAFYPKDKKNKDGTPYEFAGQQIGVNGEPLTNRSQFFGSSEGASMDFRKFMNNVLPADLQIGLDTKENNKIKKDLGVLALLAQKSKNILEDLMSGVFDFKARKNEAMMARELVKMQVEFFMQHKMVDNAELQLHLITFGSNMSTASRRAAFVWGVQEGLLSNGTSGEYIYGDIKNAGKDLELEHGIPHNEIIIKLVQAAQGKKTKKARSTAMDEVFVDYEANIITKAFDKAMTATGVQSRTYAGHISGLAQGWSQRLYNELFLGHPDTGVMLGLESKGKVRIGDAFGKVAKAKILPKSVGDIKRDQTINAGIKSARSIKYTENIRGITVLDFDDTLATSKSKVLYTDPQGNKGSLTAEEFAKQGADLLAEGYVYDFSEFSKVVGGKTAPLFNKAMKLQKKFGPKNMFVLTARPADSAPAIFEFLKANGLNIPLENITGLANSTAEAKAMWMAEKVGEGYNDFYFADDAIQNVKEVKNVLDQLDVKSKVQQAKLSRSIEYNEKFNKVLEDTTGVDAEKRFSRAKAKMRGEDKGKYKVFIPPSADDFVGLIYSFLGKGKKGELDFKFFKEALIEPLNRAYIELNMARQAIANDYKKLTDAFPEMRKQLYKKLAGTEYTVGDAIRVYLWDKAGYTIPGLSGADQDSLVKKVNEDPDLKTFADTLSVISRVKEGYTEPGDNWQVEDIRVDLMNSMQKIHRKAFFAQFLENVSVIFSEENLNKIEAIYGSNFREALEDMLYRIENGTNRSFGSNRLVNRFMNFINGSIGTTMFFNSRSAILQTLSTVNFINWKENNPLAAAKAFANQKQFWSDFSMIFNSTFLKQRRAGLNIDVNASELTTFVSNSKEPIKSAINWLLQKGFLPTQMMDSFAIAMGGATFYRNNVDKRLAEGMTLKEAEEQAFLDMQEIAEETQQSARPDKISQQQASVLGRLILAFQNTPMQYTRLIKKAILDLQAGRGDAKSNISRIIYYGAIQNVIFYSLQTALFAMMFGDDEDEEVINTKTERVINGSIDSILRGMGVGGAVVSTVKNMIKTVYDQKQKPRNRREEGAVLMEFLNLSPPIGIKARQIMSGSKTLNWNEDKIAEMPLYNLDNPIWEAGFNYTQALTNVPLARLNSKVNNIREATSSDNETWQRIALFLGWSKWNLGIKDKTKKSSKKRKTKRRGVGGGFRTAG